MWIYTNIGLLLPTRAAHNANRQLTRRGELTLQLAARSPEILQELCRKYLPAGSFSEIVPDPMDGWRVFTTEAALTAALGKLLLAVDYQRFDPQPYAVQEEAEQAQEQGFEPVPKAPC